MLQEYIYCPTEIIIFLVWHAIPGSDLQQMLQQKTKNVKNQMAMKFLLECPHLHETLLPHQARWWEVDGCYIFCRRVNNFLQLHSKML